MNKKGLNIYSVTFEDGTTERVYGVYAAHCWEIARQLFPEKAIKDLELEQPGSLGVLQ